MKDAATDPQWFARKLWAPHGAEGAAQMRAQPAGVWQRRWNQSRAAACSTPGGLGWSSRTRSIRCRLRGARRLCCARRPWRATSIGCPLQGGGHIGCWRCRALSAACWLWNAAAVCCQQGSGCLSGSHAWIWPWQLLHVRLCEGSELCHNDVGSWPGGRGAGSMARLLCKGCTMQGTGCAACMQRVATKPRDADQRDAYTILASRPAPPTPGTGVILPAALHEAGEGGGAALRHRRPPLLVRHQP